MTTPNFPDEALDAILRALAAGKQRATYSAVSAILDRPQRFLMGGRPRDPYHSWIVNKESKLPTGYEPHEMHPDLLVNDTVIDDADTLRSWLATHS